MKQKKTNAARRLDELKIAYRLMEYTVDEEHLDAVHTSTKETETGERMNGYAPETKIYAHNSMHG